MPQHYLKKILSISAPYLKKSFSKGRFEEFLKAVDFIYTLNKREDIVKKFSDIYIQFIKDDYQRQYQGVDEKLSTFLNKSDDGIKIIWGDCFSVMKGMKSESIHCMVMAGTPFFRQFVHSFCPRVAL